MNNILIFGIHVYLFGIYFSKADLRFIIYIIYIDTIYHISSIELIVIFFELYQIRKQASL